MTHYDLSATVSCSFAKTRLRIRFAGKILLFKFLIVVDLYTMIYITIVVDLYTIVVQLCNCTFAF